MGNLPAECKGILLLFRKHPLSLAWLLVGGFGHLAEQSLGSSDCRRKQSRRSKESSFLRLSITSEKGI
jgi:hypothetical protein